MCVSISFFSFLISLRGGNRGFPVKALLLHFSELGTKRLIIYLYRYDLKQGTTSFPFHALCFYCPVFWFYRYLHVAGSSFFFATFIIVATGHAHGSPHMGSRISLTQPSWCSCHVHCHPFTLYIPWTLFFVGGCNFASPFSRLLHFRSHFP